MTDTTDVVAGAIPGLLAVGLMAGVAAKMLHPAGQRIRHKRMPVKKMKKWY